MENGNDRKLSDKFSGLTLNDPAVSAPNNDSLFQVMKAVEAAEATIKQQAEENSRLKSELQRLRELDKYKIAESIAGRPRFVDNQDDRLKNFSPVYPSASFLQSNSEDTAFRGREETRSETSKMNGTLGALPGAHPSSDNASQSQFSVPSPNRDQINLPGHGFMPMTEVNNSTALWNKAQEREEEILQLRKQLGEYSIKEAQIRNEKYVLEKRIAYMRLAFDQQQQDLVDAASKALSYRQDIIEENIRLTYALQAAQQERTTFVSSLLPLLAEYSLQPPVPDAQSIVSNVKVLFRHLQEKLILTESKLKESQYQLASWRSDVNHSNFAPQSPTHSIGVALTTSGKNGLELVTQPTYSHVNPPTSSSAQTTSDWHLLGHQHGDLGGGVAQNMEPDDLGRYSPFVSRPSPSPVISSYPTRYIEETTNKQVTFRDPVSNSEMDDPDTERQRNERESPANWASGSSPYPPPVDDPNSSYSPGLEPVLEEPSSSYSEVAEDDPLPAIDGLQISGDAYPGRELQACGYSINGTTSCNFEWVRHLEDGSVDYIEGAKQPNYLVSADDVDTYLAIEVQPLDDRKRKGELVKVFANEHRKITCDPDMQSHIVKTLYDGHVSYQVSLTRILGIWEQATLAIKREGYSIKCGGTSGIVVTEKFSPNTNVTIPYGDPTQFLIIGSDGVEHLLQADSSSSDISSSRDCIVLTLRLFIMKAGERKKGKKRGIFFNK
ncbi:hypothetical protein SLEP1_g3113 [Rubroshorea leprosula]|uniref:Uncharacterized protein n=3 Tax=Rubroshorea leprosula TaxID=152421 RepID=A0AAV5HNN3_9ROSI|nr:hypothetical protein SLEP1_g3113 [Rubroshorea leprosula]